MHLVIEMKCDGDAFNLDPIVEVRRILKELSEDISNEDTKSLKDINGNPIGYLSFVRPFKSLLGWKDDKRPLNEYLQEGDCVDEDLVTYFAEDQPPITYTSLAIQMGEPYYFNENGDTYLTLEKIGSRWVYTGIKNKI